jgi:DNA-binding NtrC family response regulator
LAHVVLIVEDELFIRMDVADHLEERGFTVLQACNAAEAIGLISAHPEIDLVFTDVRMPGEMDGLGLAKWIMDHQSHMAVMVASGDVGKKTIMDELCGAHAFPKPYRLDEVSAKIRATIEARRIKG